MFLIKKFSKEIENLNQKITEMEERIKKLEWKEPASLEEFVKKYKYKKIKDLDKLDYEWFDNKMIGFRFYEPDTPLYLMMFEDIKYVSKEKCVGYAYDMYKETKEEIAPSLDKLKNKNKKSV